MPWQLQCRCCFSARLTLQVVRVTGTSLHTAAQHNCYLRVPGLVHLFALSIMMTTDKVPGIQLHSHPPSSVPKASGCSSYYATTTTTIAPSLQSDYGFHIP